MQKCPAIEVTATQSAPADASLSVQVVVNANLRINITFLEISEQRRCVSMNDCHLQRLVLVRKLRDQAAVVVVRCCGPNAAN